MFRVDNVNGRVIINGGVAGSITAEEARELAEKLTERADEIGARIPDSEFRPGAVFVTDSHPGSVFVVTAPVEGTSENAIWLVSPDDRQTAHARREYWETEEGAVFRAVSRVNRCVPAAESGPEPEYEWGVMRESGNVDRADSETEARQWVRECVNWCCTQVVRRRTGSIGGWEDA